MDPGFLEERSVLGALVLESFNKGAESLVGLAAAKLFDTELFADGADKIDGCVRRTGVENRGAA